MINRFVYLPYYLFKTNWPKFHRFLKYVSKKEGISRIRLILDMTDSVIRYNIAPLDYFYFRFYALSRVSRDSYAGTGYMYEYQKKMNPPGSRQVLADKKLFLDHYRDIIHRKFLTAENLNSHPELLAQIKKSASGRVVLKNSLGQVGAEVEIFDSSEKNTDEVLTHMRNQRYDLLEQYVVQHRKLMELSPSGLNTVRIVTQLHNGKVVILAARLRISVNSPVDNMAAGNLAAPLDIDSGIVMGPAVYSDITKQDCEIHPVTGIQITGFAVPYWTQIIELVSQAALRASGNKSIGWDVAVTDQGPELIEGNHNWCKLLWQLPVKSGLKHEIEKYL
jgi:hypothetical protein